MIHKTCKTGSNFSKGKNLKIGPYTVILDGVIIGDNVTIGNGVKIGNNVTIYDGVTIGSNVILEDNVNIGENTIIESNAIIGYTLTDNILGVSGEQIKNNDKITTIRTSDGTDLSNIETINFGNDLNAIIVSAIKELNNEITTLKANITDLTELNNEITTLKANITDLTAKIQTLENS